MTDSSTGAQSAPVSTSCGSPALEDYYRKGRERLGEASCRILDAAEGELLQMTAQLSAIMQRVKPITGPGRMEPRDTYWWLISAKVALDEAIKHFKDKMSIAKAAVPETKSYTGDGSFKPLW